MRENRGLVSDKGKPVRERRRSPLTWREDKVKLMPLTQGQFSIVDDEEYAWLSKFKWHYDGRYARRNSLQNEGNRRPIYMHRVIAKPPDGMKIDHIDGNKLNNTRANLRVCTHSENQHNRRIDCEIGRAHV